MRLGLVDPTRDSQRIFRAVLGAMAHPGLILDVAELRAAPAPLHPAAAAVCLALVDLDTPLWLDGAARTGAVVEYLRFHTGAPVVYAPCQARVALIAEPDAMPPLTAFDAGSDEYPDGSATLIVQTLGLAAGTGRRLVGPGIADEVWLEPAGLPAAFWAGLRENHARFPRGVDVILTAGTTLAALPRTTRVGS
jgi:alpha-D-ribose 1-methylphosphonate 5-triphosphate synthase subunit PhnH